MNKATLKADDRAPCLGNMSAPPRSTASYSGLGNLLEAPGKTRVSDRATYAGVVTFCLAGQRPPVDLPQLLTLAGISPKQRDPKKALICCIEARAKALALPDGAAVADVTGADPVTLIDPVTVLAVLTKSSEAVWLREKTPRLSVLLERVEVSLIVPPAFIERLRGGS